jgi:hypothetical protein
MKDTVPYHKHWNAITSDRALMFGKLCLKVPEKFGHQETRGTTNYGDFVRYLL